MAEPVLLALVWHMHQPTYRDALTGKVLLPWTRLHATKDYGDMVAVLRRHPRVHATFNLTPVLLDQIETLAAGESDSYLDIARKPAESLSPDEQRFLTREFFSAHPVRMIEPHPRYRELRARCAVPAAGSRGPRERPLTAGEIRDLQTWFHLAWVDPEYHGEEPIRSLLARGRGFREEEKQALLDWGISCAARIVDSYREAERSSQVELSTSAYHHPILPLVIDTNAPREVSSTISLPLPALHARDDAFEQLRRARESHARRFGTAPRGTWPPEGAVNQDTLAVVREAGFEWCASDESVLARALGRAESGGEEWAAALSRAYRVNTEAGPVSMVFRDRALSDGIGFTYMDWEPERAAEDFVRRALNSGARARARGVRDPLVTVIVDGENCWESYPNDGRDFLEALYRRLSEEPLIAAVTVGEALSRVPAQAELKRVPVGSWIAADLSIWIGHAEKTRAWSELRLVRERLRAASAQAGLPGERIAEAREEILTAEASDWYWWYGDDHQSAHKEEFDRLFRSHLIRAYNLLGFPAPARIRHSLRSAPAEGPECERVPYIAPRMDGRDTHFYEWRNAELFDAASDQGADHRTRSMIRRVLFGLNESDLFVRVDGVTRGGVPGAVRLRFTVPREVEARVPLAANGTGPLEWAPLDPDSGEVDRGEFAIDRLLEIRVPLARLHAAPGTVLHWRVLLEHEGEIVESLPRAGHLASPTLDPDFAARNWSAT